MRFYSDIDSRIDIKYGGKGVISLVLKRLNQGLLISNFEVFFSSALAACGGGQYECANKKCIPISKQQDGRNDCGDNSDEGKTDSGLMMIQRW